MHVLVASLLIALVGYSSAQVFGFGGCPDVRPVEDFDFRRYAGRWYEIARFYNAPEEGFRCQTANYTMKENYMIGNDSGFDAYGRAYSFNVPIYRTTDDSSGRLYYASEDGSGEFTVAFVDYERYSAFHICKEYLWGFINVQNNWIFARERTMSEDDYDNAMRYLARMGINVRKFKKADQRDCPVYRDDRVPRATDEPEVMPTERRDTGDEPEERE